MYYDYAMKCNVIAHNFQRGDVREDSSSKILE